MKCHNYHKPLKQVSVSKFIFIFAVLYIMVLRKILIFYNLNALEPNLNFNDAVSN